MLQHQSQGENTRSTAAATEPRSGRSARRRRSHLPLDGEKGIAGPAMLPPLTARQGLAIEHWLQHLHQATHWHGQLPVAVLDRCWLKLRAIPVEQLAQVLPPDTSFEAPELVRYRQLVHQGLGAWDVEQLCWQEFGQGAWREALRRYWSQQEQGNHGWTLDRYLQLLETYRQPWRDGGNRRLPLLVLARHGQRESHALHWLDAQGLSMRHTCL